MDAATGKLEKMLILAYNDSKAAESGGKQDADATFEVMVNPESFTHDYRLKFSEIKQGHGTSGTQLKYEYTEPEELTLEFIFDSSGIIDGKPRDSIVKDIQDLKEILIDYKGDIHEPRHYKVLWGGNNVYKGRVKDLNITYKLFSPNGKPLRALVKVKFISSVEGEKQALKENKKSPDLTHHRRVKAGDTLHLMCKRIYGDASYYLQVAEVNKLGNFRRLAPGQELLFPPIDKTVN